MWKIVALQVQDYKRARLVKIEPGANQAIIKIAGKNANGKSSVLDALSRVLGGKLEQAKDPVHHGAKKATIVAKLADGEDHTLNIELVIKPEGESKITITDQNGNSVKSPQAVLDAIVGGRALDPLAFKMLPAKEQRAQLIQLIDKTDEIGKIDLQRARIFDQRTNVGRDRDKAKGELDRLGMPTTLEEEIDVSKLSAERATIAEMQRAGEAVGKDAIAAEAALKSAQARASREADNVLRLEREMEQARIALDETRRVVSEAESTHKRIAEKLEKARELWGATTPRRDSIDADLARATVHNKSIADAAAENRRRAEAERDFIHHKERYETQTTMIDNLDQRKLAILTAAKLPVPGLSVNDETILLNGAPFAQASSAEQLRVALALAIEAQPNLADVWIKDGSLLDDDSMAAVCEYAEEKERSVWIEVVGTDHDGAIVISDGQVAS